MQGMMTLALAATIAVSGPQGAPVSIGVPDLEKLGPKVVTVDDAHGKAKVRYKAVPLAAVAKLGGAPFGDPLRGKALAGYVEVGAADGYRVVFSFGELDPGTGGTDALLAFEADGAPLPEDVGPFRIV